MGDSPERLGNEASFVALCGVSPVEHFSRRHHCRRLNRGGDRQANAACTGSCRPACAKTCAPRTATRAASRRARPDARSSADSNADSNALPPGRSSTWSGPYPQNPPA
ncbi:transposase [Streptomyces sp. WAC01526]|uniref:transposase n=1 Tax=Streptomyces sp. WAC01526 TaxID=2588709 RepID=UPI0021CC7ED5|nr:transposase [Streptomyces sp. WAC01526]